MRAFRRPESIPDLDFPEPLSDALSAARFHVGALARFLCARFAADALVLGRHVMLSARASEEIHRASSEGRLLLAHELEHVAQYRRLGVPVFLRRYLAEYARGRLAGASHARAYAEISFEREARERAADVSVSS